MIIKSKTRKTPSFRQLLMYMMIDDKEPLFVLTHNVLGETIDEWVRFFTFNEQKRLLPRTETNVVLYHEIISFSEADKEKVDKKILLATAKQYLATRYPNAIFVIVAHNNTENPHLHVAMSGVEYASGKPASLRREAFANFKLEMEQFQRTRFPELETVEHEKNVPYIKVGSAKDKLRNLLRTIDPYEYESFGIELYRYRGKLKGVMYQGRKYRFKTLGIKESEISLFLERGKEAPALEIGD